MWTMTKDRCATEVVMRVSDRCSVSQGKTTGVNFIDYTYMNEERLGDDIVNVLA